MSKRPALRIIRGSKAADEIRIYRLRAGAEHEPSAPAMEWPRAGAWRELVHRLMREPIVTG